MLSLFHQVSQGCSRITTEGYSTSFASAIRLLHKDLRNHIYNIYGLVRFADEIVDTFHDYDKATLLQQFRQETFHAIRRGISLNPILHSFQLTVNKYDIDLQLVHSFFDSMEMDLQRKWHDSGTYNEYIYGSAEVVGLMCLNIFCEGDREMFSRLKPSAQALGAAFQKVNFLRDVKSDYSQLNRSYFPAVDFLNFTPSMKQSIEDEIAADFNRALPGIVHLPLKARFGVYVAYQYYLSLFNRIRKVEPARILKERVRIPNYQKAIILMRAGVRNQLNLI